MHSVETPSRPTPRAALCAAVACVFLALGGVSCGQRGPLYLPPQDAGSNGGTSGSAQADKDANESDAEVAGEQAADDEEDAHEKTP